MSGRAEAAHCGELYVYYRLRAERAPAARAAFAAAAGDAALRLLQRADAAGGSDGLMTWLEVYPAGTHALEPQIAQAMRLFVEGERHREAFVVLEGAAP